MFITNISNVIYGISDEKKITSVFSDIGKYLMMIIIRGGRVFNFTANVYFSNNLHVYFISSNIDGSILKLKTGVGFKLIYVDQLKFSVPQ